LGIKADNLREEDKAAASLLALQAQLQEAQRKEARLEAIAAAAAAVRKP
jgi:hypothetical protein